MTEIKPLQKVQMVTFSKIYVYSSERLICYQEYNQTTFLGLFRARMKREEFSPITTHLQYPTTQLFGFSI